MIRWKGFLPFLVFSTLIALVYFFYANYLVKNTVELLGWEINKASVNLHNANISLSPLGIRLNQLQIANAKQPEKNAVEFGKISFKLDSTQMLYLNWIIDEMHIEDIRFDTRRKRIAKVVVPPSSSGPSSPPASSETASTNADKAESKKLDIEKILAQEDLHSMKLAQDLESSSKSIMENWQTAHEKLPNKDKLEEYKKRVKQLEVNKAKDVIKQRKELKAIRNEIKQDIKTLSDANKNINREVKKFNHDRKAIKTAFKRDINHLKNKYAFNQEGMENYAKLFFSNSSNKWLQEGLYWYEKIKPYLAHSQNTEQAKKVNRWKGINVAFYDRQPMPKFLLKSAKLSLLSDMGEISGQLLDVSSDQTKTKRPAQFILHSTDLNRAQSLDSKLIMDFREKTHISTLKTQVLKWQVKDWSISKDQKFPLKLIQANVDFTIDAKITDGNLGGGFSAHFKQAKFDTRIDGKGMEKIIANTFQNIEQFTLFGKLKGSIKKPGIRLKSDLDSVIKKAMGKELRKISAEYQNKLESQLKQKLQSKLGVSDQNVDNLKGMAKSISDNQKLKQNYLAQLERKLKDKQQQKIDKEKDRLKDKLKNKLRF